MNLPLVEFVNCTNGGVTVMKKKTIGITKQIKRRRHERRKRKRQKTTTAAAATTESYTVKDEKWAKKMRNEFTNSGVVFHQLTNAICNLLLALATHKQGEREILHFPYFVYALHNSSKHSSKAKF